MRIVSILGLAMMDQKSWSGPEGGPTLLTQN